MNHERDQRVEQLFLAASELEPEQRSEFLDKACPDDAALRAKVTALLAQDADPHELMKTLALGKGVQDIAAKALDAAAGTEPYPTGPVQGRPSGMSLDQIGLYRITREIGRGGMGVVYEATQEHPCRTVALKVLKHGFASRSAMRRFEYESHILGQLRHPGIAQVYEAGTYRDDSGAVPFFAMEYVPDAKSITEFSAEAKLSIRDRLALFANVCNAVHHGHQKGIIHRDLKPANILVDAQGQVKIIDFGVARSTDSDLAVTTVQTDIGQLVGTLQYMSPEQCQADPHSIDIRSDVYALGVVFYELLCGRLPYDVRRTAIHEATRVIREEPPARLSSVNKTLRGDIETIALKALEKERERRYASALELAEDIHRYLGNEPLKARPPSAIYMLRKFARRNRVLVAATMTVMCTLVAGVVVSTTLAIKTKRAEGQARRQQYVANIRAADFALSADDVTAVGRFLDQAPPNLRKWEWYYLRAASDTSLLSLTRHKENIRRVAFTDDGSGLASVSADGIVCTWDRATGSAQFKIRVGSVVTESVAMNSDGSLVALGGDDGAVRVWQTSSDRKSVV